jgi:transposase
MTAVTTGERLFLRATSPRNGDRISELDVQKEAQLLSFFLALTADERHDRFGRVVTDDFIRDWRAGLTATRYCAVGRECNGTLVAVVELSRSSWLVPGLERHPLKKLDPSEEALLALLRRWRDEAARAGRVVTRVAVAFEAGRDGFWLARWLRARGIEAYVIHPTSIPVSREHRRAKSDRLDTQLLQRALLGWLRGEIKHCSMAAIPTLAEEDARRPNREHEMLVEERSRVINRMKATMVRLGIRNFNVKLRKAADKLAALLTAEGMPLPVRTLEELRRDMARLQLIREQIAAIEKVRLARLKAAPQEGAHPMLLMLAKVLGIGVETADMLVHEVLSRKLRDRRAVARYAGLTGSPDESGSNRREKGLAKSGNARVRRGLIQLAWRFLRFQKDSALAQWYRTRTEGAKGARRTTMIVALARKLLIALWRLATHGEVPQGVVLRPAG